MVTATNAVFEMYQDARREWRWRFLIHGEVTARSYDSYSTKESCLRGVERVRRMVGDADVAEQGA